jgi:hypothetical protein
VADAVLSFEVNQLDCLLGMRAVIEPMRAAGGGSIVNVASGAALGGLPLHTVYGGTKWAVRGMTKSAAMELGEFLPPPAAAPSQPAQTVPTQHRLCTVCAVGTRSVRTRPAAVTTTRGVRRS